TLQGTPLTAGTFNFTIQVTDKAGLTASQSYSLVVSPPALTITVSGSLPAGTAGVAYSQKIPAVASGGTPPYTWSVASGSALPSGLTFTPSTLLVSGTPNTAGTSSFTIQVADSSGLTSSKAISLTINPATLTITTSRQLPDATLNQAYAQSLAAVGGQSPYRWTATGLPAGLSINSSTGQISGTPSAAGNFGIAITVTDAALANSSDRFTLNVNLPPAPGAILTGLPASAGPAQQFPL